MILRKVLTIISLLFIILIVSGETVLPWLATNTVYSRLTKKLATNDVMVNLDSNPSLLMYTGYIGQIDMVAHQAKLGELYFQELSLQGKAVRLDLAALFSDEELKINKADSLQVKGIVSENNLRDVIARHIERLENVQVAIHPDGLLVTANAKVFGRTADIELTGQIVDDAGSLYLNMTSLRVKNTLLGTAKLEDMFGNIQLVPPHKLPLGLKLQQVEQTEGAVIITAGYDKTNK